ncbi:MAG: hypothetical protein COA79_16270 [Planctomycetota bacterium]|nr:MAG: hypothetical protein COA79_16270 [Planctomycetota bacterium]
MKVFITSGNTWIRIDPVRVVTNVFTGETGLNIANYLSEQNVDVILASSNHYLTELKGRESINYRHYQYFEELDAIIKDVILNEKPDVIIHAAAVSDYQPKEVSTIKIKSNLDELDMGTWVRTKKLIHSIRQEYGYTKSLIQFKLETLENDDELISVGRNSLLKNQSNLCIANRFNELENVIAITSSDQLKMPRSDLHQYLWQWISKKEIDGK